MAYWIHVGLIALTVLLPQTRGASDWPLPQTRPEKAGFSQERLEKMHGLIRSYIDQGKHAGAIAVIARNGKLVDFTTYGFRDLEARAPMRSDTIVRVYSMSKVITSVAVLMLYEEGRFSLTDPISMYIPELKDLKVCVGGSPDEPKLVDAKRPITIKHLLTHTSGLPYEFSAIEPVKTMHQRADLWESTSLKDFIQRLAKLPLVQQPGEGFTYGVNIDVLGYLIEVISGQPLEQFMQERIFNPLKMKDTGFDVPPEKMSRLAKIYEAGPDGKLREAKVSFGAYAEKGRGIPSGGGGLFSTAGDYLRFGQMLLNGGKLDGKQILGRKTVELMMANNLTDLERGSQPGNPSEGFGLGGGVRLDLAKGNSLGSIGQFGWNGAATTSFNIDPKEKTVVLLLTQHFPYNQTGIFAKFYTLFYQALVDDPTNPRD